MVIESLRVRNYKVLRDVHLTKMPRMAVFVGANGSGKSTLLDVFAFLQECVTRGVEAACEARGGVHGLVSQGEQGRVEVDLTFRLQARSRRMVYTVAIENFERVPIVAWEILEGFPFRGRKREQILSFAYGVGTVAVDTGEEIAPLAYEQESHQLGSSTTLALRAFGQLRRYATVSAMYAAVEDWTCAPTLRLERRPNILGRMASVRLQESAALTQAANRLHREHRDRFNEVVRKLSRQIPGLKGIEPYETDDKRLILRFADGSFQDPFPLGAMSEGTRRLLSIYLMLHVPEMASLLTYEEPENDLYPAIVWPLAEEFREYAGRGSQVLVSTHSPDFVNALNLDEVYWMEKREGFAQVVRAQDDPNVSAQNRGGALMGSLWTEGFFGKAHPR